MSNNKKPLTFARPIEKNRKTLVYISNLKRYNNKKLFYECIDKKSILVYDFWKKNRKLEK